MKRFLPIIFAVLSVSSVAAQEIDAEITTLKPTKGSFVTELNFNPFKGNLSLNNALNQIKGRYFVKENLALRLGVGINTVDSTMTYGEPYGTNSSFNNSDQKKKSFDINIGIEKHFKGTSRISPYIGVDISYGVQTSSQHISSTGYSVDIKNAWMEVIYQQNGSSYYSETRAVQNAYTRFGIHAIAGFDYYMAKNFFVGYEFNLGYLNTDYKKPEVTATGNNSGFGSFSSNGESKSFRSSLLNGVRIGFAF